MKKIIHLALSVTVLFCLQGNAQTVTAIEVFATPTDYKGKCPVRINFTAVIHSKGKGSFKYIWLRSDGATDTRSNFVLLSGSGNDTVRTTWDLGGTGTIYAGWQSLKIISPAAFESARANFRIACDAVSSVSHPWKLTSCAEALLRSYRNLVSGTGLRNCPDRSAEIFSVDAVMPLRGYGYSTADGTISFASLYSKSTESTGKYFRNIWGASDGDFSYYGACTPSPLLFPATLGQNHVYAARLIRQADFEAYPGPYSFSSMESIPGIRPVDIASIETIYMDDNAGFSARHDPSNYNNVYSSAGLLAKVKLKNGAQALCYLINNYDGAGTVLWKEANTSGGQYVFDGK